MSQLPASDTRPVVIHVVTGGFSGATQVAVELCLASLRAGPFRPVLVLRRKRRTPMERVAALRAQGLEVHLVKNHWWHQWTVWTLARLLRALQPVAVVAHGFPEHLIGRQAGLHAGVPVLIQVEHNSRERYSPLSRWLSRRLARRSAAIVGVSAGVREVLLAQGLPAYKTVAIPNGIDLSRFSPGQVPRQPGIVMSARFARQKDHDTLLQALHELAQRHGLRPQVWLAGQGPLLGDMQSKALRLGLSGQVTFLGYHRDMPALLASQQIFVLATHFEGMPLALVEAMAAGCACVASDVVGVRGVLEQGVTGLLVPEGDAPALADALAQLLCDEALSKRMSQAARQRAISEHGLPLMVERYDALISRSLTASSKSA